MKQIPIILDTDPGVDDFFCIALACAFKEYFDLKAITTIGGNNSTDVTTRNALDILHLLHREDVTVARGADSYLTSEFGEPVARFHGANGIGDVKLNRSVQKIDPLPACDKIYQTALEEKGELVIVTVGPETNLAMALLKYPDLKDLIRKIIIMGGTLDKGNVTEYAEANIYHDAKAASIVFSSGIPFDMVGLNVTRKAPLRKTIFDGIENTEERIKEVMLKLIEFRREESMHDAIAISSLIDENIFTWKKTHASVIIEDEEHLGMTAIDDSKPTNARVAAEIDIEKYYEVMKEMIRRY